MSQPKRPRLTSPLPDRLRQKFAEHGPEVCWPWLAAKDRLGYGRVRYGSKVWYAHRLIYELLFGAVMDGYELDHLCRNASCVNPRHLEPVTHRENMLRGQTIGAAAASRTHCVHGHSLADALIIEGKRRCRECNRVRCAAGYQRRKAAGRV